MMILAYCLCLLSVALLNYSVVSEPRDLYLEVYHKNQEAELRWDVEINKEVKIQKTDSDGVIPVRARPQRDVSPSCSVPKSVDKKVNDVVV